MVDDKGNSSQVDEGVQYPVTWKNPTQNPNAPPKEDEEASEKAKLFGELFANVLAEVEEDLNGEVEKSKEFMKQFDKTNIIFVLTFDLKFKKNGRPSQSSFKSSN